MTGYHVGARPRFTIAGVHRGSFHHSSVVAAKPMDHHLQERRVILKKVLQEQIQIAETLLHAEGMESKATRWAWDVVEEVARKLNRVEDTLFHSNDHDRIHRSVYDEELSRREYDL